MAELLTCLEASRIEEISEDVKRSVEISGSVGKDQTEAALNAERDAVNQLKIKYATGTAQKVVDACVRQFEAATAVPSANTASTRSLPARAAPAKK